MHKILAILLLTCLVGSPAWTQQLSMQEAYRLQVGDVVEVSVYGEEGTRRSCAIDHNGNINYLLVGAIPAAGKTIDELRAELNERLRENFRFALVSVIPLRFGGMHYSITGEVQAPGRKPLFGQVHLLDAIAQGGGFRQAQFRFGQVDLEDLEHAFVARGGDYLTVDFEALIRDGDMSQNIEVEDGDYIHIPNGLSRGVHVLGEVIFPSNIGYHNGESVVSAVAKARGPTVRAGNWVSIIRGSLSDPKRLDVNLEEILNGKARDVLLKPGDIVFVPPRWLVDFEEILTAGVRSFVSSVMHVAGERLVEEVHPHAKDDDRSDIFFP